MLPLLYLNEKIMKAPITLLAIFTSAGLTFGQGMPAEATSDAAKFTVSYTADATMLANAGDQNIAGYSYGSLSKNRAAEGAAKVNHRIKAAAARADGDYIVADPQSAMEKHRKNSKKKMKEPKIR